MARSPTPPAAPAEAPGFTATRWVPANATYALSAHSVADAQHLIRDFANAFGFLFDASEANVSRGLSQLLGVDALSVEALRNIGVDPEGGFALFSDDVDPTFAVHLSAPDALPAFFDKLHAQGMVSQSVIVDGVEIFSASLGHGNSIAWVIQGDWLLAHFVIAAAHDDGRAWVAASMHRTPRRGSTRGSGRTGSPSASRSRRRSSAISTSGGSWPRACEARTPSRARRRSRLQRVGIAYDADGRAVSGRITFELGAAAGSVATAVLPDPPGWMAASAKAPIAAQWNLDVGQFAAWASPCAARCRRRAISRPSARPACGARACSSRRSISRTRPAAARSRSISRART